ncbi:excisionase family DNA-binding protein [Nocardia sp. R6R-6]|uniref:excisionase family DNA-binding protein n=1 Tax=Nocardia sp. R6R-6 TaxID=3459303 RepID=UPI00403D8280
MTQPRRLVSMKAAAEHLGCHYTTIQRRTADGSIPTVRVGRLIRVDLDALEAMEAAAQSGPAPVAEGSRLAAPVPDPRELYADFIAKLVADAPPLTADQVARISTLLNSAAEPPALATQSA